MKSKKMILLIGILLIGMTLFWVQYRSRPIYIGFGAGLSGQWSQLGVQARNGFLLAVDDMNEQGGINGRKIVPVIMDDKNDNEFAKSLRNELKDKKIHYFVGFCISAMTPTIEYFMEEDDIFVMSPTMSTNLLSGKDDYFFRICNASANEAYTLLKIMQEEEFDDFAIVYDHSNEPYTLPTHDIIVNEAKDYELNLLFDESFDSHDVDFHELAKKIHESGAHQVAILASGVDTAEIAQQLKLMNNDAILYANSWSTTQDLLENGGRAVDGMRVVGLYDITSEDPEFLSFQEKMIERYGNTPTFPQIFGYESLKVLKEAMEMAGSTDIGEVKKTIINQSTFKGLQQMIEFDEYGDMHRNHFIYEVKDGEFKSLKK